MSMDHESQLDGPWFPRAQPGHLTLTPGPHQATHCGKHKLNSTLSDTTEALVGTNLSEEEHNIVSALGPLGGCSLRAPSNVTADAAFLRSRTCTRKAVQEHAEAMGRPLQHQLKREGSRKSHRKSATRSRRRRQNRAQRLGEGHHETGAVDLER